MDDADADRTDREYAAGGIRKAVMPKRLVDKWEKALTRVALVMQEIQDKYPEYQMYLQEETAHLMSGPSHDTSSDGMSVARRDLVVRSVLLPTNCSAGAW